MEPRPRPAEREGSSTLGFADEVDARLFVRLGRRHRYWGQTNGGGGPSVGVTYRGFMGTRLVAVTIGLDLSGAR